MVGKQRLSYHLALRRIKITAKAANAHGIGTLDIRQDIAVDHVYTGKQTNGVLEEADEFNPCS